MGFMKRWEGDSVNGLTGAILCSLIAISCGIISIRQFKEKGFLFNNAYIWANKQEREALDKKPHYRQSGIVFALCTVLFSIMGVECVLLTGWLWLAVGVLAVILFVYAVTSSISYIL